MRPAPGPSRPPGPRRRHLRRDGASAPGICTTTRRRRRPATRPDRPGGRMGIGLLTALDEAPSVAAYARRTPRSAAEFARACRLLPGGVGTPIHYKLPHPLFIARARGSRMWDVD